MTKAPPSPCTSCGQPLVPGSRFCNICGTPVPVVGAFGVAEPLVHPLAPGDLLEGKWRVERLLGQGAMGSVYLATDVALGRKVAVKALAAELCGNSEFTARFEREARLTANLDHPNVVTVFGVGRHFGQPFIVMKYLDGETLSRRVARSMRERLRGLALSEVLDITEQLCSGLDYIHSKGLVHRDIKAGNVIVGPDGRATLLDFGILRDTIAGESLTRAGVVMGTAAYVSPEQILGQKADHRADVYAVGILLYELLTGVLPFDSADTLETIEKHVSIPAPDPCSLAPGLPHPVCKVLLRAVAKKPGSRFQSAGELSGAFAAACGLGLPDARGALPRGPGAPDEVDAASTDALATMQTEPIPEPAVTGPSTWWAWVVLWVGLGALALVLIVAVGKELLSPDEPRAPQPTPLAPPPAGQPRPGRGAGG